MIAPQRHDVHTGHASESHVFAPVAPVRVTVRHRGKPPRSRIGGEMLSRASHDAAPLTHKHHRRDTSEYVPVSEIRNLVVVLEIVAHGILAPFDAPLRAACSRETGVPFCDRTSHESDREQPPAVLGTHHLWTNNKPLPFPSAYGGIRGARPAISWKGRGGDYGAEGR